MRRGLRRTHLLRVFLISLLVAVGLIGCGAGAEPMLTLPPPAETLASPVASTQAATPPPTSPVLTQNRFADTPGATPAEAVAAPSPTQEASGGPATSFPNPEGYGWTPVASGLSNPIAIANAGDGSGRLFVLEQQGRIRIIRDGALQKQPFLDISAKVDCCGERGLLGLAFHPNFEENGFFYVNYIEKVEGRHGDTVIARFQVSENPDQADPASETRLLSVVQPYPNHNGGSTVFGPDGYLYLGLGDGGSGGDPLGNGQNTGTLLGKILRLDVDGAEPYAIPADNPFAQGGGAPEVWAYGLRNPWRFSFDRLTGDLWIGEVGQNAWEEIDYLPAGSPGGVNFGWNYREGTHPFAGNESSLPAGVTLIDPVAEYGHDQGVSVTGGFVYRGGQLPEWRGIYLYGDYGSGFIWGLFQAPDGAWQNSLLFQTGMNISSFGEDEAGEIYLADYSGSLYRLARK